MRVFVDTNILISTFISSGLCDEIIGHCAEIHEMIICEQVEKEALRIFKKKIKFTQAEIREFETFVTTFLMKAPDEKLKKPVCRDKDDDTILATAAKQKVDCILTGDKDLLVLEEFQKIPIISPKEFWKFEETFLK
jgi:putative PIN family toxin of toxin-antitoxin system